MIAEFDAAALRIAEVPGVFAVVPQVEGQAMATANNAAAGVLVRGLRAADLTAKGPLADGISPVAAARFQAGKTILLGNRLAQRLGVAAGDRICCFVRFAVSLAKSVSIIRPFAA